MTQHDSSVMRPRELFGKPLPPALDHVLDNRWVQLSIYGLHRSILIGFWMAIGAFITLIVALQYIEPGLRQALFGSCELLSGPEVNDFLQRYHVTFQEMPPTPGFPAKGFHYEATWMVCEGLARRVQD
jgi:hypothetical protein